jgi:serine/threonine-protein kinase
MMHTFRFGRAEFRPAERRLLIEGAVVGIGSRAFHILDHLIANRHRVVSKEELLAVVWPNTVVEENNLHVQISALRKLLGPGAVATIPGLGYQFTAELMSDTDPDAPISHVGATNGHANGASGAPVPVDPGEAPIDGQAAADALQARPRLRLPPAAWLAWLGIAGVLILLAWRAFAPLPGGSDPLAPLPPENSIAVLPFVNMSGDPDQDYFSEGITDELLNSLSTVGELQVAARTSSFSFKGTTTDITEIARRLKVRDILEGSVRRDGTRVRISATLISAATGYHLWSQTYERDLKDVLTLQKDVASEVTKALQAKLLTDDVAIGGQGGTNDPRAFDDYLRAEALEGQTLNAESARAQVAAFEQALRLDPSFAQAYIGEARALAYMGGQGIGSAMDIRDAFRRSRAAAEKAVQLAPNLGRAHAVYALVLSNGFYEYARALAEYDRALTLAPGDAAVLRQSAYLLAQTGRTDLAIAHGKHAVALDPLNAESHLTAAAVYAMAKRYRDAIESFDRALLLNSKLQGITGERGLAYFLSGELEAARESCLAPPMNYTNQVCLSVVYERLNQHAEAQAQLAALQRAMGETAEYQYAQIFAQWGDRPKALDALELAYRLRDSGLTSSHMDAMLDPLRKEPRFQAVQAMLQFPAN